MSIDDKRDYERLRGTVTNLLQRIEQNQQIQARFHDFEFSILKCTSLDAILNLMTEGVIKHFDVESVALILDDKLLNMKDLMAYLRLGRFKRKIVFSKSSIEIASLFKATPIVFLDKLSAVPGGRFKKLLSRRDDATGSVAILPLMRSYQLIGAFAMYSTDEKRYSRDKAFSFLWHLGSVMSICLQNCIFIEEKQKTGKEDALTKVANRRYLEEKYHDLVNDTKNKRLSLCLLFVDIDHFKSVNDQFGHKAGDVCLAAVASTLKRTAPKKSFVARYGGEEFAILLESFSLDSAVEVAERIRKSIEASKYDVNGRKLRLTVSIGVACLNGNSRTKDIDLFELADKNVYEAKSTGRNRVCHSHVAAES